MSMSFYVPAEQQMKDKADFARKNIARGKALAALLYADGILICAENTSATLRKVSEIYDRIAFAGAGKYNEYDRLRIAGVRHADLKGYSYSREDVDAQSLANAYAQMLGDVFTHEIKPMEVEIVVAELGMTPADDRLFHIFYDGTVVDEDGFTVLGGGEVEAITERLSGSYQADLPLPAALVAAVRALSGSERQLSADDLEVAVLARGNGRRAFRRLTDDEVTTALAGGDVAPAPAADAVPPAEATAPPEGPEGDGDGEADGDGRLDDSPEE
ncbi:MAG TPA: proteasome subunit alpha [Acidimicrobiales bacterium]|nr:proteasome subunit alpha [Acidimicrobiales bacterium]